MNGFEMLERMPGLNGNESRKAASPRTLQRWLQEWQVPAEALRREAPLPQELPYGRKVLHHSEAMDVVLVHLPPGAQTWIHDHGRSVGCAFVLEGQLSNCIYSLDSYGFPQLKKKSVIDAHEWLLAPKRQIHQMRNEGEVRTVSLHVYAPALKGTRTFYAYEDALDFVI
ncbi:cysteine dioxygenase [Paenibacillus sp. UNCCL117]|uniref:cysteine dioxygenase n=1 Tax=unclassified Paenibacillus TaxID=185978 RepID=UPI00088D260E|nr:MULTISPECIES: cysteine dioxygenase family protein [unclassified Paenibacillus]SDD71553.1 cysteine dioxygenase [Paenibacillus sp. cl123]SFW45558.1 cysteine dioxygenase [Paenibacillus sp. UNCCL117]